MGEKEQGGMLRFVVVVALVAIIGISVVFATVKLTTVGQNQRNTATTNISTQLDIAQGKVPSITNDSNDGQYVYQFNDKDKTAKLSYYSRKGGRDVIVPTKVRKNGVDYIVTSIDQATFMSRYLTSVAIPDTVTSIGDRAFMDNQLTTVKLPANLKSIGDSAFQNNQISSIVWPKSLTYMSQNTFMYNQLSSLDIPNGVTYIDFNAFAHNNLTNVSFPDTITGIYRGAFTSNNISKVSVPSAVTSPENAFDANVLISTK